MKSQKKEDVNELTQRELDMMADRKQKNLAKRGKAKPAPRNKLDQQEEFLMSVGVRQRQMTT